MAQKRGVSAGAAATVVVLALAVAGGVAWWRLREQRADEVATVASAPEAEVEVTAAELVSAYRENEIAADARFRGKMVRVTGTVFEIGRARQGNPYVAIGGRSGAVGCWFAPGSDAQVAPLARGEVVVLRGRGFGLAEGFPFLSDCQVVAH